MIIFFMILTIIQLNLVCTFKIMKKYKWLVFALVLSAQSETKVISGRKTKYFSPLGFLVNSIVGELHACVPVTKQSVCRKTVVLCWLSHGTLNQLST